MKVHNRMRRYNFAWLSDVTFCNIEQSHTCDRLLIRIPSHSHLVGPYIMTLPVYKKKTKECLYARSSH